MFDKFLTPGTLLKFFNLYPAHHGCNRVHDGLILQSKDEEFESIIRDLFNFKSFVS